MSRTSYVFIWIWSLLTFVAGLIFAGDSKILLVDVLSFDAWKALASFAISGLLLLVANLKAEKGWEDRSKEGRISIVALILSSCLFITGKLAERYGSPPCIEPVSATLCAGPPPIEPWFSGGIVLMLIAVGLLGVNLLMCSVFLFKEHLT